MKLLSDTDVQLCFPFAPKRPDPVVADTGVAIAVPTTTKNVRGWRAKNATARVRSVRSAIRDWPRADRPRDKILDRGPSALSDAELLAILLRTGGPGQTALDKARALMDTCEHDWRRLAMLGAGDLCRHSGIGCAKAALILAALEIAKRYGEREWKVGEALRGSADVYAHFRERLAAETREHFYAVLLDNKHRKLKDVLLSLGSLRRR